nr:glycosyltransferase [uncultured Flavobacterium sp.]
MSSYKIVDTGINSPDISIAMLAYNHEKFIGEAIESVLIQKTNYTYKIIIAEDFSTDSTREIVLEYQKKYPDKIKLILQDKNVGASQNNVDLLTNLEGKYIAALEGDDYWTDPLKLQKQVDFLEANKGYSICWTKYHIKNESNDFWSLQEPGWVRQLDSKNNITIDLNSIFTPYCTYTLTAMFRRGSFDLTLFKSLKYGKDNSLYAICLGQGKGMLMNFNSAVYRMHTGGIYSNASEFKQKYYSYLNLKEIVNKVPLCDNLNIRNIRNHLLLESIKFHPNILSIGYINLVLDSIKFLGLKKSIKLVLKKYQ